MRVVGSLHGSVPGDTGNIGVLPWYKRQQPNWQNNILGFIRPLFFRERKLLVVALVMSHSRAPEKIPADLILSGIFVAGPSRQHLTNLTSAIFVPLFKRQVTSYVLERY
jgi:hypothetical protein